jgi:hypothetical protein
LHFYLGGNFSTKIGRLEFCYHYFVTKTVITPQTASLDECGIVATFTKQSLDQLTIIQDQLSSCLGDTIWITPRRALHSTLMEVICDREYTISRKELFAKWYTQYSQIVLETLADVPSFDLIFSELEFSPRAIIVRSASSEIFNNIRSKVLSRIKLPEGTKIPPDITHCSLARYSSGLDLAEVLDRTKTIKVNTTEHISSFSLHKDLGPPIFEPKLLQRYELRA